MGRQNSNRHADVFLVLFGFFISSIIPNAALAFTLCSSPYSVRRRRAPASSCFHDRPPPSLNSFTTVSVAASGAGDNDQNVDPVASIKALNELVPRSKITNLQSNQSNLPGAVQTAWHFGLVTLAFFLRPPWLSTLAAAFLSSFYFMGLHECVHGTAFRSQKVNVVMAHLFGLLCARPACHYRYYHWQHHCYTGDPDRDSELMSGSFLDLPINNWWTYLAYLSGIPFWIDAVSSMVRHACGNCPEVYLSSTSRRKNVVREARFYLAVYAALAVLGVLDPSIGKAMMRFWVMPAILGQPFLRFYLLAEHRGRKESPLVYENTRTMQTYWWYRKLAWNMPYHMEHHAWPSVPFYRLAEAHTLLMDADDSLLRRGERIDPSSGKNGYFCFHWSFIKKLQDHSLNGK